MPSTGDRLSTSITVVFVLLYLIGRAAGARAEEVPRLSADAEVCSRCHSVTPITTSHLKIPGGQEDCLECHNPHSRAGPPLLKTPAKEGCTACHFEYGARSVDEDQKKGQAIHAPVRDQSCSECHLPHDLGAPSRYRGGDENASCAGCHDLTRQKQADDQHGPFRSNLCVDCHDPHASKEPQLLRTSLPQLCGSCHKASLEQVAMSVEHNPFVNGRCTDCHSAHAGNSPAYLKVAPGELCLTCHLPEQKPIEHGPYRDGICTECHDPHASETRRLLKAESNQALCVQCHAEEVEKIQLPSRHPVGDRLNCSSCHRPHTADYPKLLPAEGAALCTTCHPNQGRYYDRIGHSRMASEGVAIGGACTNCHLPHGSVNAALLKGQNEVAQCRTCHMPRSQFEHPTGDGVLVPGSAKPVVCTSCHDPHGSPYSWNTHKKGDGLCITCHDQ